MRFGKKFTRGFVPTLLVLVAMLVTACEGSSSSMPTPTAPQKVPASQQILRLPLLVTDIATFDPGQATDLYSGEAIDAIFTGMVQLNDKLEVTPQMATGWTTSSDNLTWTFHLRSGLQFSDGTQLTSRDVIYSIDRSLSPLISSLTGIASTYLGLIQDSDKRIAGKMSTLINDSLMAPDATTVVIKLNKPGAYFLQALTYPTAYVIEKKVIDQWGLKFVDHLSDNGGQGGDGPFVVQSYDHTKGITLVPNPRYYGPKPQVSQLQLLFYKDPKTNYEVYQTGQIDETFIPSATYDQAKASKEFIKIPDLSIGYFAMNYMAKPFNNIDIRRAFELAINKDVINTAIWKGRFVPTCHIVPGGMPGYNPNLTCPGGATTQGDPAKAKQLFQAGMQQEGYTLATFPSVTITYPNGDQNLDHEITTVQSMWKQALGINVKSQAINFSQLLIDLNNTVNNPKGLQMWDIGWIADYPDPQDWTTLQFGDGQPYNYFNYGQNNSSDAAAQQQVQQELETADVTANATQRFQMYNDAEQQLVNDVAWMPVEQVTNVFLRRPYVVGMVDNGQGLIPPDDWANIYIVQH